MFGPLADTHCHLTVEAFSEDLDQVVQNARRAGVTRILVPGLDVRSSQQAIQLTRQYDELYAAIGVHPHAASQWTSNSIEQLERLAQDRKVVAIGEIGLDFYRNLSSRSAQLACFQAQLELADKLGLPIVVHNRDAAKELFDILLPWKQSLGDPLASRPGVLHAFSASETYAKKAIEHDFFLGIGGPITFEKAEELRTLVYNLPIDRLLVETDSPYLTPVPNRGKRNEPANVQWVVQSIARIREQDPNQVARKTTNNAETLFGWSDGISNHDVL